MKTLFSMAFVLSSLMFFSSCAYRSNVLPALNIAGPNLNSDTINFSEYQMAEKEVTASDSYPILIIFPILGMNQDLSYGMMNNAIEKACQKGNYDFLLNVKIYNKSFYIPYLFGLVQYDVKGEGWKKVSSKIPAAPKN